MTTEVLTYLDHNILDPMTKGDPFGIKDILNNNSLTPVFSMETLKEIKRSVGYEDSFLNLLNEIGAKYIESVFENNLPTGTANINAIDAFNVYKYFLDNENTLPEYGYGMTAMLEKFFGGRQDETFADIFASGGGELTTLFDDALVELENLDGIDENMRDQIKAIPSMLKDQYNSMSNMMDKDSTSAVKQFEDATGLGAKILKNISSPNVVPQIFEKVNNAIPHVDLDIDVFFGVKPQPYEANSDREKTLSEKVNAIYHQLNFLGYYRDTGMKNTRGFVRSSSDMTHAGMATFCHFLFCRDEGLVKKTAAAYEYLGVNTKILYF